MLFRSQGKYTDAESHFKQSLAISEKLSEGWNPLVARSLNNWGEMDLSQSNLQDAQLKLERALEIYEKLEREDVQVAETLTHLAVVYRGQGKETEAEKLEARANAIRAQQTSENTP